MEVLYRYYNIHYIGCVGSLIYLLSTRVDLCFVVHNLEIISSNPGKVHLEGLVHLLRHIRDNIDSGMIYYARIDNAFLSDILKQANINTETRLMVFSNSWWQDCSVNGRSTGTYIAFYKVGPIYH